MEFQHILSNQKKFKTNKITVRFTAPLSLDTIAGHMLSASMLETANQMYPTSRFEETLGQSIRYRYVNQLFQKRAKPHYRIDIYLCS